MASRRPTGTMVPKHVQYRWRGLDSFKVLPSLHFRVHWSCTAGWGLKVAASLESCTSLLPLGAMHDLVVSNLDVTE